jgi:hypothetical protein
MNDTTPKQAGLTVEQTQVVCRRLAAINYQLEAILTNGGQSPVGSQGIPDNPTDERIILQAIWEETECAARARIPGIRKADRLGAREGNSRNRGFHSPSHPPASP